MAYWLIGLGIRALQGNERYDGWMTYCFRSFSAVFQSYQNDGQVIMNVFMQWNPVYNKKKDLSLGGTRIWIRLISKPALNLLGGECRQRYCSGISNLAGSHLGEQIIYFK